METRAANLKIGDTMPDGSIYAGVSPDTGRAMYTTQKCTGQIHTFHEAEHYAAELTAHGHRDWRVPTDGELNVLFENREAIRNFDTSGSIPAGWYWSSSQLNECLGWGQRFSDGFQYNFNEHDRSSLRCVRG